jgi:hypothetical protein
MVDTPLHPGQLPDSHPGIWIEHDDCQDRVIDTATGTDQPALAIR